MIAQEVEQVFPDWVGEGGHGYKTLGFTGFEALTVDALRELRAEKDAQIETLRAQNEEMQKRLERLERLLIASLAGVTVGSGE
jgi:chaperonin cofactor prefoldin